jgi:L-rhamnose isomerase/sugar isomerase|tara:strand:- start:16967 stop:18259 length:1293 start_codon:yes stop_codon:yes gene_type:complete
MRRLISAELVSEHNESKIEGLREEYDALGALLSSRGIDIESVTSQAKEFAVAVPSWGTGTGGTRFARFPGEGEPGNIFEKLEDAAVINQLVTCTPKVSPHFPWDSVEDMKEVRNHADDLGLLFDAVNSNTFQDQPDQKLSYKFGSLSHVDPGVRAQAVEHNLECIEQGKILGSTSITLWVADGSNFPGQSHFQRQLERYLESTKIIYEALPDDWQLFLEHKMFEPAFYSTVVQDWGTSVLCAMELGDRARSLVDLGHHAPNVNIEMIVSRLIQFKKLAGFHFNDSKYGDDDLDSGSINPFQLFLVFNELVDAEQLQRDGFDPAYMLDQSHNVTDPAESLMSSANEVLRAYVKALLIDRKALSHFQEGNDALMANQCLKSAYEVDVTPILKMARYQKEGAIEPITCFRSSMYRANVARTRAQPKVGGGGIV